MIKSVISSAAQLSLAPARLAGRLAGSLVSGLRGNGASATPTRRRQPARAGSSSRSRTRTQSKRRASSSRAKAAPKRAASGSRAKAQPKRAASGSRAKAQPRRTSSRTRATAQPARGAPRPRPGVTAEGTSPGKPLDDVTIARKVESIIFRGIEVDKGAVDLNVAGGVLWLRGEVPTADLINELETRANKVTEVRRVENLLHVPESPAPTRPEASAAPAQTTVPAAGREDHVNNRDEAGEETPTPAPSPFPTTDLGGAGHGRAVAPLSEHGGRRIADSSAEDEGTSEQDDPEPTPSDEDLA